MAVPMETVPTTFAFVIATKNRCTDLVQTLQSLAEYTAIPGVRCVVYDDGSTDGTQQQLQNQFPEVEIWRNQTSKGYLYCRNQLLNNVEATYLISLDDDAHFLSNNVLETIQHHFESQPSAGVLAFRIFWSKQMPEQIETTAEPQFVKSFVGCGHVWRKSAWNTIPNYPEWYQFYGEENWASLQLYAHGYQVLYVPQILVHHRVDLRQRAQNKTGFTFRYRCSLRADWYTYFMLYPLHHAAYFWLYSLAKQIQKIGGKAQFRLVKPLLLALFDLLIHLPKLVRNRKPLSSLHFRQYQQLKEAKVYWNPEK